MTTSALDPLIRKQVSINGGAPVAIERAIWNLISVGASATDNPSQKRTDITLPNGATAWTLFTPVLQTSDSDFSLGATGTAAGKWRTFGTEREVEIRAFFNGGGGSVGSGLLYLPLAASSPPTIDTAQLLSYPGDSRKIFQCHLTVIDDGGEDLSGQVLPARVDSGLVAVDTSLVANGLPGGDTPANGTSLLFHFSVPVL